MLFNKLKKGLEIIENIKEDIFDNIMVAEEHKANGQVVDKKKYVIKAAVKAINTPLGDNLEEILLRPVLDLVINLVVYTLNKTGVFKKTV